MSRSRTAAWLVASVALSLSFVLPSGVAIADETSAEAADLVLSAEEALKARQYKAAAEDYLAAALASDDPEIAQASTRIAYTYGFDDEAIKSAKRWAELDPDSDEANIYVAQVYLRKGEIRSAARAFDDLLHKSEEPVDEQLLRLVPVLSQEDATHAYELMERLARGHEDSPLAQYAVAVLALNAGETGEARERAKKAMALDEEWIQPHLVYARSLLLEDDQDGAIDYIARLVGDDPDPDPEARIELAIMYVSAGRDDDALSQVNQVLLEQPYRSDALRLMAIINFRLDYLDAAKSDFEDLLRTGSYQMEALYYLGRIADRRSEFDDAIDYYSQVTAGDNAVMAQSRVAGILAEQGKTEQALEFADRFAEINPTHAVDMLRTKAQLLAGAERYGEALGYYDELIAYRPDSEGLFLSRAELLLRMGNEKEAISAYRAAARRWSDSALSLNALGYTLADRTDKYDEAERLIRKALKKEPGSAAIIDSWGWVLHKQGRHDEALEQLELAYEKLHDPEVAAHIVEVLLALGRENQAMVALEEAEQLFPDNELLQSVRERLQVSPP